MLLMDKNTIYPLEDHIHKHFLDKIQSCRIWIEIGDKDESFDNEFLMMKTLKDFQE